MALRNQPYLPLYIQDIMTDEKLNECSAATHGIFIKGIMCLMHKSDTYGKILLKQKYKQKESICLNFASQLVKHLPYTLDEICNALTELSREGVIYFEDDYMCQKRMIKDNDISEKRSASGKKGGNRIFAKAKQEANTKANQQATTKEFDIANTTANTEYEDEYENEINIDNNNLIKAEKIQKKSSEITQAIDEFFDAGTETESEPVYQTREVDEEEYAEAIRFLRRHKLFALIQKHNSQREDQVLRLFKIFFEQKDGFEELKNKTPNDVIKNFYYWVPKYLLSNSKTKPPGSLLNTQLTKAQARQQKYN